ncbi:hypothetical protein [Pyxidicoccus xibeiensis]|uniref:hypothetical protein n=1 Tax=Pyxidicoccus xibeiensis TaxID=2906759 RepID=UPI0020A7E0A4|nr:hypothetical protein [Pyxidicoccus xibeiensis]MCP3136844.1 hypothetical protein [Pyxidicoccus xibeiensis]
MADSVPQSLASMRPRSWRHLAVCGLGLALACTPRKAHECAAVQMHVMEEVRVMDGFHDLPHDAEALVRHTRRLRTVGAELRALELQDASLRGAVERYLESIDNLASACSRVADSRGAAADAGSGSKVLVDGQVTLGVMLSTHASSVNHARSAISDVCGTR